MLKYTILLTITSFLFLFNLTGDTAGPPPQDNILQKINKFSFMVVGADTKGSGIVISRKRGNDTVHFVWTVAHVLSGNQIITKIIDDKGKPNYTVSYTDVDIYHDIVEGGETVGFYSYTCNIIRYSCADRGEDLALLQVKKRNINIPNVIFYDDTILDKGHSVWHVGCILGESGFNSVSGGVIGGVGRIRNEKIFDQTCVTGFFGSSGCGIFSKSTGQCIGIVTQKNNAPSNLFYRPTREIKKWAKKTQCEWAFSQSYALPSDEKIREVVVHDIPVLLPKEDLTKEK